jgi:hypothetical protein
VFGTVHDQAEQAMNVKNDAYLCLSGKLMTSRTSIMNVRHAKDVEFLHEKRDNHQNAERNNLGEVRVDAHYFYGKTQENKIAKKQQTIKGDHFTKHSCSCLGLDLERETLVHEKAEADAKGIVRGQGQKIMPSHIDQQKIYRRCQYGVDYSNNVELDELDQGTVFLMVHCGALFVVRYCFPRYSLIRPRKMSWMPEKKVMATMIEAHP